MNKSTEVVEGLTGMKKEKILGSWINRIMRNSMQKQALVHPCVINGENTLVYERGLELIDPVAFSHLVTFANTHDFKVKEDQRADFLAGVRRVKEKRRANVVTVMALTASLLSTAVSAKSLEETSELSIQNAFSHKQSIEGFDLDLDSYSSQDELVAGLLGWVNNHSDFNHNIEDMPDIVKISQLEMANVAFGGELPKAINPENLQIYGLYNFNEGAVYILDSLDLDSHEGKSILLHELVHFLQYQYDQDENVKCKNELESLAYLLEAKYLQAHDQSNQISMDHIEKVSQCR